MDEIEVVRGRRRGPRWRQVAHGLHRSAGPAHARAGEQTRAERRTDLLAWQHLLPPSACFTHLTAAEVYGLWLPPVPPGLPVLACVPKGEDRPRRDGIRVSRLTGSITPVTVDGVRVAPLPEVLLACSRDLKLLDLVVLLDSALRGRRWVQHDFEQAARPRRRGAPALRESLAHADARAESPWESLLRLFHVLCGVPVEPQREVYDERGVFVARGDLWLRGTTTLHEYDGAVHRDRRTHAKDLARERGLANIGWTRRGYTAGDLLGRALAMLREADAAIGRHHDPGRLEPWRAALRESLFTEGGRRRLEDRWGLA
jgi:hypothetical protein